MNKLQKYEAVNKNMSALNLDLNNLESIENIFLLSFKSTEAPISLKNRFYLYLATRKASKAIDSFYEILKNKDKVINDIAFQNLIISHKDKLGQMLSEYSYEELNYKPLSTLFIKLEHLYELIVDLEISQSKNEKDEELMSLLCDSL